MLLRKVKRGEAKHSRKAFGVAGSVSGAGGIISAHNVCHAVCLGVVAVLSIFGIAISSTALMFLQDYNMIFWTMGVFFLLVSLLLYARLGKCMSPKLIVFNTGLVIAGSPFFIQAQQLFWVVGFSIAGLVSLIYLSGKMGVKI